MSTHKLFRHTTRNLLLLALTVLCPRPAAAAPVRCTETIPLTAGDSWYDAGRSAREGACFQVDLTAPGILLLEVSTAAAAGPVRLVLTGLHAAGTSDCPPAATRLQQSATSLALSAPRGYVQLRVTGDDPRRTLPPFVLHTRLAAASPRSELDSELEIDPDPLTAGAEASELDSELEIDPDPTASCGQRSELDSELEIDPDPLTAGAEASELDSELEIDPDPTVAQPGQLYDLATPPQALAAALGKLCQQTRGDDHGDTFACATPLTQGQPLRGDLHQDGADDEDVFRFEVTALQPVAIRTQGEAALSFQLYDRHGQPLNLAARAAAGTSPVRTLVPGTYFLRLRAEDGSTGSYQLTLGSQIR